MDKPLSKLQIEEYAFCKGLVDFNNNFNLLDRNLVLCLGWLHRDKNGEVEFTRFARMTVHEKLEKLKKIVADHQDGNSSKMSQDFTLWFQQVAQAKVSRNDFIHGSWCCNMPGDKPIRFESNYGSTSKQQQFTLKEFQAVVAEMTRLFHEFMRLRKKYLEALEGTLR